MDIRPGYIETGSRGTKLVNYYPKGDSIVRVGYRNMFGLIWMLLKTNWTMGRHSRFESAEFRIKLPIRWF